MKVRVCRFVAVGIVAAFALAGCSTQAGSEGGASPETSSELSPELAELYEAAQQEGPLTWYGSYDPPSMEAAISAFESTYPGLRVDYLRLTSGQLNTRFSQEIEANAPTADVITVGDPLFVATAGENEWLTPLERDELPSVAALDDEWYHDGFPTTVINVFGIAYNSDLVEEPPTSWEDVIDPAFKGKTVFGDYRAASLYAYQGALWAEREGMDYLEDLAAQDLIFVDSIIPGIQKVASGEALVALAVTPSTTTELVEAGAPIEVVFPDWYSIGELLSGIASNTDAPSFSRLFVDFLLSEQGQEALVSTGGASPINSEGSIPLGDGYVRPDYEALPEDRELLQSVFNLP
ncbi:ABC transporter substrate-binding protein [Microbacterium pygmaeum]|uniref:Extracellular solute-binding protein n=1 Tax=Microbacterium pygmaeum TaxID=370764 RepID=A0A1G7XJM9_9MICO|nr:extracellular solute-binding protein [Microbacterium pygmaeum]SDG84316.1 extracellular solute-binding protein [Microbacterium pygmaeum]